MTLQEALDSGCPFFRRKNFVQWIFRDVNGGLVWRHWEARFHLSAEDEKATDWEVWNGRAVNFHGPTETKILDVDGSFTG